jgi:fatty acid desaturase
LTHGSLIVMTVGLFALLLGAPVWVAAIPGVLLTHRIGVMLHEYIHGIPFRRYANCLRVLAFYDGLMLMFGLLELFRATHLSHHRWLNTPGDSGFDVREAPPPKSRLIGTVTALEITQHIRFYVQAFQGRHPYARTRRLILGVATTGVWMVVWVLVGRPDMIWKLMALTAFTTAVPVSLRGAIEHHAPPGHDGFANEYKVLIPLFNLNKHVHHHEAPRLPWYRLEFRTPAPLHWRHYFTYWFRVYLRKDLVLMHPMPRRPGPKV